MTNILELAKKHNFTIEAIEVLNHGTVIRGIGKNKLDLIRADLLSEGYKRVSCHREEGSAEAFIIIWK
jgi:hypothetical protein